MDFLGEGTGAGHGANVRGDNHKIIVVVLIFGELAEIVFNKSGVAQQMIHGNIKESLDLGGVKIHGQDPVSAGGCQHIGHQLCGDGIAALGLAILTGVTEVGDDGGYAAGGSPAAGVDHDQQLHQVIVYRLAGGLNQEYIRAADSFNQGNGSFAVGKGLDLALSELDTQLFADGFCEFGIGIAAENLDTLSIRDHQEKPHFYLSILP